MSVPVGFDANVEYQAVDCPFCLVCIGQPCIKVYGKHAGEPADWPHTKRAYKYWGWIRRKQREKEKPVVKRGNTVKERDQAVKDIRTTINDIRDATSYADVRRLAERLKHQAHNLMTWASQGDVDNWTRWEDLQDDLEKEFA